MEEKFLIPVQDAHNNPALEFREGQCLLRSTTLGGTITERFISWETVREAALKIPIDSGWLTAEIVRWGTGAKGEWVIAFIPPGRHKLEIEFGTPGVDEAVEYVTAPLPGMVFFGHCNKYFVWAQKFGHCEPHHELYRCPLPNVMIDGSICWGLLKPPNASPRTILKAWELFIKSTFNAHAAPGKSKAQKEDVRLLLKELAGQGGEGFGVTMEPVYPLDDLVRQVPRTGVTLDQAIRGWFEQGAMPQ